MPVRLCRPVSRSPCAIKHASAINSQSIRSCRQGELIDSSIGNAVWPPSAVSIAKRRYLSQIGLPSNNTDEWSFASRIDLHECAVRDRLGNIEIKTGDHREIGERGALDHDRIGGVQYQSRWHDTACLHFMQHPGRGNTALRCIEHKYPINIALPCELMLGSGKQAVYTVEIIPRRETILCDQGITLSFSAYARCCKEDRAGH